MQTYRIRRIPKCHPKKVRKRLQNQQKINVGSLCKACSSTSRFLKGPRIHFRALGSPKWPQHGAKRAPKMEPKSMPKSISSRSGVSGGLGRAPSPLLETILVPFWCQIGSISESSKGVPGTSKSFQKPPKTTFRVTDRREAIVDGIVEQTSERLARTTGDVTGADRCPARRAYGCPPPRCD